MFIYLSKQLDLIVAFQIYSEGSPYLLPGRINRQQPIAVHSIGLLQIVLNTLTVMDN